MLIPPKAVIKAGLLQEWHRFLVHKALYGLAESPADWASYRDEVLKTFRWTTRSGKRRMLAQLVAEHSIWIVLEVQDNGDAGDGPTIAVVGLYVDDLLLAGPPEELQDLYKALSDVWQMAAPTWERRDPVLWIAGVCCDTALSINVKLRPSAPARDPVLHDCSHTCTVYAQPFPRGHRAVAP